MKCIGFGGLTGKCRREALPRHRWCRTCDRARLDHLSRRFKKVEKDFKRRTDESGDQAVGD